MSNVSGIIKSIQDIMRKDVGVDGDAQRISQLVWMFFLKIYDDREAELELLEDNYKSPLPEHMRWRNWAADPEGMTGDGLNDFVNLQLFPTLKTKLNLQGPTGQRALVVRNVFEDAYNYMKSGTLMRQVINKICEINFNNTDDRHTFGNIYEQILKDLQSAGNAGEFYTPRAVTQFIVNRVDPQLKEIVLDPACGTGGFLACTIDHKREKYVHAANDEQTLQQSIHGVEKKALPHMLCTTNMILHGIDTPTNIKHDNTLSRPYKDYTNKDRVHVIVTNPPFGGMEEDGIENNFPKMFRTRETADLFMALIIKLLKSHGRAAVVLPDGFLFGEGMKTRLKQELLKKCNLHTIVRLPNGVFAPYTGIKTNILFFTKKPESEQPGTSHVWYYEHPYPDGVSSYNKTKPMRFEEFETEIDWWGDEENGFKTRKATEQAWQVDIEEIVARNYNLDIKNPHVDEQINHDPEQLLGDYQRQQDEIQNLRDQLKAILSDALTGGEQVVEAAEQLITANLDIWSSAVKAKSTAGRGRSNKLELYGIKKLRELILGTALAGGFSTDKGMFDQPVPELLKNARANYSELNGRKLKEYKQGDPLIKEFDLPPTWPWVRIADLCDLQTGATPSRQKPEYFGGDIRWLVSGDINQGEIDECEGRITEEGLASSNCKALPAGTVMIALNGQGKTRASVAHLNVEATCNQSLVGMIPFDRDLVDSRFLLLALRYRYYEIRDITGQNQRRGLNMGLIAQLSVPLPPIDIQRSIVAKVDELMALCDQLEQQQETSITAHQTLVQTLVDALTTASERDGFTAAWARIADHFDTLFTTEWSIDQLKQTILQLAVMGKLVPQNPNDEPASVLLKKISAEKAQLVKEGKIKKQKPLAQIKEDEKPHNLPSSWSWVRFGDVAAIERGGSPRPIKSFITDDPDGLNWIKIGDTDQGGKYITSSQEKIHKEGLVKTRMVYPGDFLLTNSMSFGRPYITKIEGCIHDGWLRISPPSTIDKDFLYLLLSSPFIFKAFQASAAGAVVMNLNADKVREVVILVPPLEEQRRIVTKVDELLVFCDGLKSRLNAAQITQLQLADAISAQSFD